MDGVTQLALEAPGCDFGAPSMEDNTPFAFSHGYIDEAVAPRVRTAAHVRGSHAGQSSRHSPPAAIPPLIQDESYIRASIDATLRELREILHRRGRLSSRGEALDEVSTLLYAHVMSTVYGNGGIRRETVLASGAAPAIALREFVRAVVEATLPASLSHEIDHKDFALKLKPQEDILAAEIIDCFGRLDLRGDVGGGTHAGHLDVLNDTFGKFLVDSFADEKELGQYLTPTEVVHFMVGFAIADISPAEMEVLCHPDRCVEFGLILDPSCGTASFLTHLLKVLHVEVARRHGAEEARRWVERMVTDVIVGIDKSERMVKLALTSMALFGFPAAKLHLANSLARSGRDAALTASLDGRVRLILTNPPFGAEFTGPDLSAYKIATTWAHRPQAKVVSEVLFLERYLDWLMPGGRCIAIVPDNILTNRSIYEDLRRSLASKIDIRSVTSLPTVTFAAAGTTTKTSALHIRAQKDPHPTFFAICHDIGYTVTTKGAQRTKKPTGVGDLSAILKEFTEPDKISVYGRWVESIAIAHAARWDATYHASLPVEIEQRIRQPLPSDLFVRDLAELVNDRVDPGQWEGDSFLYIEISDVDPRTGAVHAKTVPCDEAPSRARKRIRTGDVLVSTVRPERRVVGVVREEQDGAVCTTGFAVLRPTHIDPLTLAYLLKTDVATAQLLRYNNGIAYPAVDEECLPTILLPVDQGSLASLAARAAIIMMLEREFQAMRQEFAGDVQTIVDAGMDKS